MAFRPPSVAPPLPGDTVGPYVLGPSVGLGGMAAVYRAEGPEGPVAVKILHQAAINSDEVKRFRREFLTLQRMSHPNVVRVFDIGDYHGYPWIAMELVDGPDLGGIIDRWRSDPPPDRFLRIETIFRQLCDALAHVHERGIVHRDLKPSNVLLGPDGRPRLTDFGVVKDPESFHSSLTIVGRLVGTVAFMAPEQITGDSLDSRADLYSLGAILYNMLTGRRPIVADSLAGYLARQLTETPKPPSDVDPRVPKRLERICMKLLQKDPARRYPSARQVLAALMDEPTVNEFPSFYGREDTMTRVLKRVSALANVKEGGVLAVLGPPGVGRTRFLTELVERAREMGVSAAMAPGGVDVVRNLLAMLPDATSRGGERLCDALRSRTDGHPWLLVVDDVDQMPPGAQAQLGELLRDAVAIEGQALLLVMGARRKDGAGRGLFSGAETGLGVEEIVLGGLDRESIRSILRDRGVHGGTGAALGRRLHEDLGGFPGPVLEQLDALIAAGWLTEAESGVLRSTRSVDAIRTEALPLPDRVRRNEAAFLDSLGEASRACLEALAVLGTASGVELVAPVAGLQDAETRSALDALLKAGHLQVSEEGLQELYQLENRRRSQVVYESIPPGRRAARHRAAAEILQKLYRRRAGTIAEIAAHHLIHGGDPAGAYPLLIQGALRAMRRGDHAAARSLCQRALDSRPAADAAMTPVEGAKWRRQLYQVLGDALRAADRLESAGDAYAQALLAARSEGDRGALGKALVSGGLVALQSGKLSEATGALEEGLGQLEKGDPLWPEAALGLGVLRFSGADRAGAEGLWRQVFEMGVDTRNRPAEIDGLWGLALLARFDGKRAAAIGHLERAAAQPPDKSVLDALLRIHRQRAALALDDGDWGGAVKIADTLEALAEQAGLHHGRLLGGSVRTGALWGMGEEAAAEKAGREVLGFCKAARARQLGLWWAPLRVLAERVDLDDLSLFLDDPCWTPDLPYDGESLRQTLLGWNRLKRQPEAARAAVLLALGRPAAVVAGAAARVEIDCARILKVLGDEEGAIRALRRAILRMEGPGFRGLAQEAARVLPGLGDQPFLKERVERLGR